MGALFFVGIMLLLSVIGIIVACIGIIWFIKRKNPIILILGGAILAVPLAFFAYIMLGNLAQFYGSFQRTGAYIEGGYQDQRFSIGNVTYERFSIGNPGPFRVGNSDIVAYWEQRDSSGWIDCGNYYRVENAMGFDLLCTANGKLFCSEADRQAAGLWYCNAENYCIYLKLDLERDAIIPLSGIDDAAAAAFTLDDQYPTDIHRNDNIVPVTVPRAEGLPNYIILQISTDSVMELNRCDLYEYEGALYLSNAQTVYWDDDVEMITFYLYPIPQELSDELANTIHSVYP